MMYDNIFYFHRIAKIGGTEQFLYEIAKKYYMYDITVFFSDGDPTQIRRLRKFIRCKKYIPGEKVKCHKAFFNFNIDMIDDVEADEYYFVSHAIYQEIGYHPPINNEKLTHYIGVSQYACDKLKEFAETIDKDIKPIRCYNPLTLEPKEKVIRIVSAGRLDDKTKDNGRTIKLIHALDKYAREHNRHYIWTIFSNPISFTIESPNVVLMKPRVDVRPYIADADFVVQLSNDMETYCYTNQEALGYGVRIITTPLTVNEELKVPKEANLICNWDMSNVDEIARRVFEEEYKEFKYQPPKDSWEDIIYISDSTYTEEEKNMKYKVRATSKFKDYNRFPVELGYIPEAGEVFMIDDPERLDMFLGNNDVFEKFVELIEEVKTTPEVKKETAALPKKSNKKIQKR